MLAAGEKWEPEHIGEVWRRASSINSDRVFCNVFPRLAGPAASSLRPTFPTRLTGERHREHLRWARAHDKITNVTIRALRGRISADFQRNSIGSFSVSQTCLLRATIFRGSVSRVLMAWWVDFWEGCWERLIGRGSRHDVSEIDTLGYSLALLGRNIYLVEHRRLQV